MKDVLKSIQDRLAETDCFEYLDENWGQLDLYGPEIPVKWPCVLIDCIHADYSNIGRRTNQMPGQRQQGVLQVQITIADLKLSNTSFKAPKMQKNARSIWELMENAHRALQGFRPLEQTGTLIRMSMDRRRREDGVQELTVTYDLGLNDC